MAPFLLLSKIVQHKFGYDRGCSCTLCASNRAAGTLSAWPLITEPWTLSPVKHYLYDFLTVALSHLLLASCARPTLSGNEMFGTSITQWVFQERGVLKVAAPPPRPPTVAKFHSFWCHQLCILRVARNQRLDDPNVLHMQASNLQHRHADEPEGSPPPEIYRVNDRLIFSVDIEELSDGGWHPFK